MRGVNSSTILDLGNSSFEVANEGGIFGAADRHLRRVVARVIGLAEGAFP